MESYKEYIERCAENCNCNGEAFTSNQGIVLAKKIAEKIDEGLTYDVMPEGYPKYITKSIEWDGDTEGLLVGYQLYYQSVNWEILRRDVERSVSFNVAVTNGETVTSSIVEGNSVNKSYDGYVLISDYAIYCYDVDKQLMGQTFPATGLYLVKHPQLGFVSKLEMREAAPMTEAFLPILTSPNGTKYKITVSDDGTLSATAV